MYAELSVNSANAQAKIEEAAAEFQTKTCVKLVRKTLDEIATEGIPYYVNITSDSGLYRRRNFLYQRIAILRSQILTETKAFMTEKSTVIHEFCHALGMNHEQSRSDRDNHLKVLFENINEDKKYNLEKEKTLDNNPYDYYSLMQYGLYVSVNTAVVIETFLDICM
ncbi:hypothetical protein KUTeg_024486 [Tegillarca granosa]|uniref:Metalloendopeptidase n=1 Tax=Tegillarca granosa TaxID=220873 RepID=A0ABQ9E373_TEGGR|nr:hypothetical protein KUTeg_024486 [Tegillarca granosa]